MVYVPNLNYSAKMSDYYYLFDPKDCVIIPYSRVNEDRIIRMRMQQDIDLYEYLMDPDKVMGRIK